MKAFLIVLLLTMGIGIVVLVFGFFLYLFGVSHEYFVNTWNQANAMAAVLEQTDYKEISDEIIRIYDSIPEEERGDGNSEEYIGKFSHILDDKFNGVKEAMHGLQNRNGPMNAFIVAIDLDSRRMIYLIDADPHEESFCMPGTFDIYEYSELDALVNGSAPTKLDRKHGLETGIQAVITNRPEFGLRCTAASTLYTTDKYTVCLCVDELLEPLEATSITFLMQYVLLLVTVTLIASFIGMVLMRRAMVKPINKMADAAKAYGSSDYKDGKKFFDKLDIHTEDEMEQLALALQGMEEDIEVYMDNLTRVTADKERINTELELAARIQKSMLMEDFPPFPGRTEFDIYASMRPAKEIGGDFYDMILVDNDHLLLEIADVSGKGIPAALFMMATKILLADGTRENLSPAAILQEVNRKVCANNPEKMFVTVWLGILEISSGIITAANAGHEYPIIVHANGVSELIHDKHGFVIGGMEDVEYADYEIKLEKGDKIFVYTDGVTEATSTDNKLFGTNGVLEALRSCDVSTPRDVMSAVGDAIEDFTVNAEQFDDLTMLCMEYKGS